MIDRNEILANLERYDLKKAKIGVVGSHSGLDTCDGATSEGFRTVAIVAVCRPVISSGV